jgi:uncharacterized protein YndB with AHSA1/START domain
MSATQTMPGHSFQLKRTFAAPRARVFGAWTDARYFAMWFYPSTHYKTVITRLDLRVGGKYSLEMHHQDGSVHKLSGTYEEVRPPEKLVFSWRWQHEEDLPGSLVTVVFTDLGGATEVHLMHQGLPSEESARKHSEGWSGCLNQLEAYLAS